MTFPAQRPRRLRSSENIRRMVRETVLSVDDLIYPVFVTHGKGVARPVESMPGFITIQRHAFKTLRCSSPLENPRDSALRYTGCKR